MTVAAVSRERDGLEGSFPSRSPGTGGRLERAAEVSRLRDRECLTFPQIAEALGISRNYACALYRDPDGARDRARKDGYRGTCERCGGPTDGSNGPAKAPRVCIGCVTPEEHGASARGRGKNQVRLRAVLADGPLRWVEIRQRMGFHPNEMGPLLDLALKGGIIVRLRRGVYALANEERAA